MVGEGGITCPLHLKIRTVLQWSEKQVSAAVVLACALAESVIGGDKSGEPVTTESPISQPVPVPTADC